MNNEPVAWMDEETRCFVYSQYDYEDLDEHGKDGLVPLYTHPVKELTDEEINIVAILQDAEIVPVGHEIWKTDEEFNKYKKIVLATAKALRKVQEK
jgi:predicted SnoaL-like aldol condensation-catalyzing enzyme